MVVVLDRPMVARKGEMSVAQTAATSVEVWVDSMVEPMVGMSDAESAARMVVRWVDQKAGEMVEKRAVMTVV